MRKLKIELQNKGYELAIGEVLDQGAYSTISDCKIYTKDQKLFKENLVVKELKHLQNLNQNHRFDREMKYLERLDHNNILKPIYCDYDEGFIIMEKYPMNLETYISENDFSEEQTIDIFYQILEGVKYYLSEGILHRDLKPKNILVDTKGNVKITDFGLSSREDRSETVALTRTSMYGGTNFYSAPEQFSGDGLVSADERSEIYSLGKILYTMLQKDFSCGPLNMDSLSVAVRHLISKSTNDDPGKRYQGIEDFVRQIDSIYKPHENKSLTEYQIEDIIETIINIKVGQDEDTTIQSVLEVISDPLFEDAVHLAVTLDPEIHLYLYDSGDSLYEEFMERVCSSVANGRFLFSYVDKITNSLLSLLNLGKDILPISFQALVINASIHVSEEHNRFYSMENVASFIKNIEEHITLDEIVNQYPRLLIHQLDTLAIYKDSENLRILKEKLDAVPY